VELKINDLMYALKIVITCTKNVEISTTIFLNKFIFNLFFKYLTSGPKSGKSKSMIKNPHK